MSHNYWHKTESFGCCWKWLQSYKCCLKCHEGMGKGESDMPKGSCRRKIQLLPVCSHYTQPFQYTGYISIDCHVVKQWLIATHTASQQLKSYKTRIAGRVWKGSGFQPTESGDWADHLSNASVPGTQNSPSPSPQAPGRISQHPPSNLSLILCFQLFCGKIILTIM